MWPFGTFKFQIDILQTHCQFTVFFTCVFLSSGTSSGPSQGAAESLHHAPRSWGLSLRVWSFPCSILSQIVLCVSFCKFPISVRIIFSGFLCVAYCTLKTPMWPETSRGQKLLYTEKHLTRTLHRLAVPSLTPFPLQGLGILKLF